MDTLPGAARARPGSLAAGAMTAVGALPVRVGRRPSRGMRDLSPGVAVGVMRAASFLFLIAPAHEAAGRTWRATPALGADPRAALRRGGAGAGRPPRRLRRC